MYTVEFVFTVDGNDIGTRADIFLAHRSGLSRSRVKKLIDEGFAVFENGAPLKPSYHVEEHDVIKLTEPPPKEPAFIPEKIPLDIVFEDNHIIVVNKPAGMVVHPGRGNVTGTLASALLYHFTTLSSVGGPLRPGIVHRLDKDTSGLLVVALDDTVHRMLSRMLQDHEITRIYTAYVWGHPSPSTGTIEASIGRHPKKPTFKAVVPDGKPSETSYETIECYEFLSKLNVTLHTGRTHQIRVHMGSIGHHVFGDPAYGGREKRLKGFSPDIRMFAKKLLGNLSRQALHAGQLEFIHPVTGKKLRCEAAPPDDLVRLEQELRPSGTVPGRG